MTEKKKGWLFKTVLILAAVVLIAMIAKWVSSFFPGHDLFGNRNGFRMRSGGPGPFGGDRLHGGPMIGGMPGRHIGWFPAFGILFLLVKIGVIMAGWLLWKTARGSSFRKWAGGLLAVAGICSLLPAFIAIPLIVLVGYFVYKASNKRSSYPVISLRQEPAAVMHSNADILDQWGNNIQAGTPGAGSNSDKEDK